jgi:hypothetical protein
LTLDSINPNILSKFDAAARTTKSIDFSFLRILKEANGLFLVKEKMKKFRNERVPLSPEQRDQIRNAAIYAVLREVRRSLGESMKLAQSTANFSANRIVYPISKAD